MNKAQQSEHVNRKCIASGEIKPKAVMLRFVVGPDSSIVPDIDECLPGRGIWLSADASSVGLAIKKGVFSRAAKKKVSVNPALADVIEQLLVKKCVNTLGLARKAGSAVCGFDKVDALIAAKRPALLLEASDGAKDGRRKLVGRAKRHEQDKQSAIPVIDWLKSDELGLAFGRGSVIHAALTEHGISDRLLRDCHRLNGFRVKAAQLSD